ncbi:TetR/AcrR family transcriptional regulator [Ketobacter sp.]|uniref:TetR/AcrR family transcriptional regulator n=1 Tax=Ketobacter sp. TaxID=2083498 RepID=UPI000F118A49|nr:TetR/AcrR family transcriptional regulator [Ketobacter sp.]RLT98707.1 MAG: TetR/AcrR family transcriptional regulator [Ketobacter sp.]
MERELLNKHGQKMGRKGLIMRKRIMDAALGLIRDASYKDLTVAEVASEASTSTSTFYVYFSDIEDVLFACVEEADQDLNQIMDVLSQDWCAENRAEKVSEFVDAYMKIWKKHSVELRVRNQEADQGNPRFLQYRLESTRDIIESLEQKVAQARPDTDNPLSLALVLFTSMERLAGVNYRAIGQTRISRKKLNNAMKELWLMLLSGSGNSV